MTAVHEPVDPAGHGAGRIDGLTVLFDAGRPICRAARTWLAGRAQLVPLTFVAAVRERTQSGSYGESCADDSRS